MAYTHYVAYLPDDPEFRTAWPQITADAFTIITAVTAAGGALSGPDGSGQPQTGGDTIALNQRGGNRDEALLLTLGPEPAPQRAVSLGAQDRFRWTFCPTGRRWDYDLAVTAILARAHQLAPALVAIGSDGEWGTNWADARALLGDLFRDWLDPAADPLTASTHGPAAVRVRDAND